MSGVTGRIVLQKPIIYTTGTGEDATEESVTELVIKAEPAAGDFLAMDAHQGEMAKVFALIGSLTGQPFIVIKQLSIPDFAAVMDKVEGFMPPGLPMAAMSSGT